MSRYMLSAYALSVEPLAFRIDEARRCRLARCWQSIVSCGQRARVPQRRQTAMFVVIVCGNYLRRPGGAEILECLQVGASRSRVRAVPTKVLTKAMSNSFHFEHAIS